MENFTIYSNECLNRNTTAFYHADYIGGQGYHSEIGRIENLICTFKNDITRYSPNVMMNAQSKLASILRSDLPQILTRCSYSSLRVCVVPRSKKENHYKADQTLFRSTIQSVVKNLWGFEDGTHDIIRHTNTKTTHLSRGFSAGGDGPAPYKGITLDTCSISDNIRGKNILLIDDLYTKSVNIDEDCIQALYEKGAKNVIFYSVGKTKKLF